jgi:hypothetical protein
MLTEWSQQDLQKKFIYEVRPRRGTGWVDSCLTSDLSDYRYSKDNPW